MLIQRWTYDGKILGQSTMAYDLPVSAGWGSLDIAVVLFGAKTSSSPLACLILDKANISSTAR